ncbi:hypothetical protein [Mesorhizobium sp. SARCC-RB16n]|uniref:hypothetical protein n=1 Tax=Mesorhizobium sp. SARCC-RB16n TaxID=2116687 RepID=UPI001AED57DF|nr:hypothetical protein [Mesorhizobium sp. SARCC-RB16n]
MLIIVQNDQPSFPSINCECYEDLISVGFLIFCRRDGRTLIRTQNEKREMLKVISGDWPTGMLVKCGGVFNPRPSHMEFRVGFTREEKVALRDIARAELISTDNTTGSAVAYGLAGAAILGPLGALMGAQAAKNGQKTLAAVVFKDGRKVILSGSSEELAPIIAAGFAWDKMAPALPGTSPQSDAGAIVEGERYVDEPTASAAADDWQRKIEAYKAIPSPEAPKLELPDRPQAGGVRAFGRRQISKL